MKLIIKFDYYKTERHFSQTKCADDFQISVQIIHKNITKIILLYFGSGVGDEI